MASKIPTTPEALASFVVSQTDALLAELARKVSDLQPPGAAADTVRLKPARPQALSATYCLAIFAFGDDDLAADPQQFKAYATSTRQELKRLHPDWKGPFTLESILQQGTGIYLRDAPNLTELVRSKPDYVFEEEIHQMQKSTDRLALIALKAKIQILEATRIQSHNPFHAPLALVIQNFILRTAESLRQMSPALSAAP